MLLQLKTQRVTKSTKFLLPVSLSSCVFSGQCFRSLEAGQRVHADLVTLSSWLYCKTSRSAEPYNFTLEEWAATHNECRRVKNDEQPAYMCWSRTVAAPHITGSHGKCLVQKIHVQVMQVQIASNDLQKKCHQRQLKSGIADSFLSTDGSIYIGKRVR